VPAESLWESLLHGRDPRQNGTELSRAQPSSVDGIVCDAEEQRLYILTEVQHLSLFFPSAVTRDRKNSLLLEWEFLKLLPPDLYRIVYTLRAEPGRFRAVPEAKLCLDGYPAPSGKADDPDKAAGFSDRASLRLALYPNALRFFSAGLHEPLRAAGAWPTTLQVLRRGFMLEPEVRRATRREARCCRAERWSAVVHHAPRCIARAALACRIERATASGRGGSYACCSRTELRPAGSDTTSGPIGRARTHDPGPADQSESS